MERTKVERLTDLVVALCPSQAQAEDAAQAMKVANLRAASYHAGKPMEQRLVVQRDFAAGQVRPKACNQPLTVLKYNLGEGPGFTACFPIHR